MLKKLKITDDGCLLVVILSLIGGSFTLGSIYPEIESYLIAANLLALGFIIDRFRVKCRILGRHNAELETINNALNNTIRANIEVLDIAVFFARRSKLITEQPLEHVRDNTAFDELFTKMISLHTEDLDYFIETLDDVKQSNIKNLNTVKSI